MWKTSIFSDLSTPTKIRDPTLVLDPTSVLLDPTKRGLRDPTLRVCKTQLAWKNKRKPSLPPHMHLSDHHHLELVTSSILVIVNSKPRQIDKPLEIQPKILRSNSRCKPSQMSSLQVINVASPTINPRPSHSKASSKVNLQSLVQVTNKTNSKASKCTNQDTSKCSAP